MKCFECGASARYRHHVIPRSLGGQRTIPLCGTCHSKAHNAKKPWTTAELTAQALRKKAARGEKIGGTVPFGFDKGSDGKLVPNEKELAAIRLMHELRAKGYRLRQIAEELAKRGIATKTGRTKWSPKVLCDKIQWHSQVVSDVLRRTEGITP